MPSALFEYSLSGADNEYSKRALGIVRAAQRGDGVKVINKDSGDVAGEMFSGGQPDAIGVTSKYSDFFEDTVTRFNAVYGEEEEGTTYFESSGIWNPTYDDGAITEGITDTETISDEEGVSWEETLDFMLEDP